MPGRLLLVLVAPARGGAEDYALTIGRAAVAREWSVNALLPFAHATQSLRRDLEEAGITTSPLPVVDSVTGHEPEPSARAKVSAAAVFARATHRSQPDVVHLTLPWPSLGLPYLLASALLSLPTLVVFQLVPEDLMVRRRRRPMYDWMRRRRQRWIAVSQYGRRTIARGFGLDATAVGVIYNGAPRPRVDSGEETRRAERASVRSELGFKNDSTLLLSAGRLHPQKGHGELICATVGIHSARPDVRVIIAGHGPERERLEQLILAHGLEKVVVLLGHRRDIARLMRASDVFVFPSHYEGTPFAMLEAMALRLPVVAARFGGVEEIVHDGRDGILVPVGNPNALRTAIVELLSDRAALARIAAAGQRRAARFSEDAMVAATMRELEELRAK